MTHKGKQESHGGISTGVKVGAGIALAAAAVAGAYFLYGQNGAKNRKKVRGWALRMKGEILEGIENTAELTQAAYGRLVEEVAERYKSLDNVDPKELQVMIKEIKGHWASIHKQLTSKKAVSKTKAAAKKVVKKAATKARSTIKKATSKKS